MLETKFTKGDWIIDPFDRTKIMVNTDKLCAYVASVEFENDERAANALLISKSPQMLEMLQESVIDLKILKSNIAFAAQNDNKFEGMPELIQKWIDAKEALIKSATEI